jgi:hypothetical protein
LCPHAFWRRPERPSVNAAQSSVKSRLHTFTGPRSRATAARPDTTTKDPLRGAPLLASGVFSDMRAAGSVSGEPHMSSVSGLSSSSAELQQLLKQSHAQRSGSAQRPGGDRPPPPDGEQNPEAQAQHELMQSLQPKIDAAVKEALSGIDATDESVDALSIIQNAVDSTLEENGVDTSEMKKHGPADMSSTDRDELNQKILSALQNSTDGEIDLATIFGRGRQSGDLDVQG